MRLFEWANEKAKKIGWVDMKLCSLYGFVFGIIAAQLLPIILEVKIWYYVGIAVLLALRFLYVLFMKK